MVCRCSFSPKQPLCRRGLGYFVADDARRQILAELRQSLVEEELPRVFRTMQRIGLDTDELTRQFARSERETRETGT